jgi:hypothetical protein
MLSLFFSIFLFAKKENTNIQKNIVKLKEARILSRLVLL